MWRFRSAPGREAEFEAAYGANGDWARLFARDPGFRGTELLRATDDGSVYLTIDRWEAEDAWNRFLRAHAGDYEALDRRCQTLTSEEQRVGDYRPRR